MRAPRAFAASLSQPRTQGKRHADNSNVDMYTRIGDGIGGNRSLQLALLHLSLRCGDERAANSQENSHESQHKNSLKFQQGSPENRICH